MLEDDMIEDELTQSDIDDVDDFLEHYGVKGMKWGVRKKDGTSDKFSYGEIELFKNDYNSKSAYVDTDVDVDSNPDPYSDGPAADKKSIEEHKTAMVHIAKTITDKYGSGTPSEFSSAASEVYRSDPAFQNPNSIKKLEKAIAKDVAPLLPENAAGEVYMRTTREGHVIRVEASLVVAPKSTAKEIFEYIDDYGDLRHEDGHMGGYSIKLVFTLEDGEIKLAEYEDTVLQHDADFEEYLQHWGVKGMKWGVRKDERALSRKDQALNIQQRTQVKIASTISAVATAGIATNAAATLFQLQARFEKLKVYDEAMKIAIKHPLLKDAAKESAKGARSNIVKGLVASAVATTVVSTAIGVVAKQSAKAYFAPVHKVYGDVKPKINRDLKMLGRDIKEGVTKPMSDKQYYSAVSDIVNRHMTAKHSAFLSPFHELARTQLGTEYGTKDIKVNLEKLPNSPLYHKMTVTTPNGLKMVKAVRDIRHADDEEDIPLPPLDFYFDYKFDEDGFITDWSCPTIEIMDDISNGTFDIDKIEKRYDQPQRGGDNVKHADDDSDMIEDELTQSDIDGVNDFLEHHGVKGMKWGVRKDSKTGGGTYVRPWFAGSIKGVGLLTNPGDVTKSLLKGTALNILGFVGSAVVAPIAAHYADVQMGIAIQGEELNKKYSQPGRDMRANPKLKAAYDKEYQNMVVDTWKNTKVTGMIIPSLSAKITEKRLGDKNNYNFDFTMKQGKVLDQAYLTITRKDGKMKEDIRVGRFRDSPTLIKTKDKSLKHSDDGDLSYDAEVVFTRDVNGFITKVDFPILREVSEELAQLEQSGIVEDELTQGAIEDVDDFLEHHGIKGMKWGIRRSNKVLDANARRRGDLPPKGEKEKKSFSEKRIERKAEREVKMEAARKKAREDMVQRDRIAKAEAKTAAERAEYEKRDRKPSVDVEAFIRTNRKETFEMSNREMKEAITRFKQQKEFNELFRPDGPDRNSELYRKVQEMKLQKEAKDLDSYLNPPKVSAVKKLVSGAQTGFAAFQAFDKYTGGVMSQKMTSELTKLLGDAVKSGAKMADDAQKSQQKKQEKAEAKQEKASGLERLKEHAKASKQSSKDYRAARNQYVKALAQQRRAKKKFKSRVSDDGAISPSRIFTPGEGWQDYK